MILSKENNGSSPDTVGGVRAGMECMCPCWNGWFRRWEVWDWCQEMGGGGRQRRMKDTMKMILHTPTA